MDLSQCSQKSPYVIVRGASGTSWGEGNSGSYSFGSVFSNQFRDHLTAAGLFFLEMFKCSNWKCLCTWEWQDTAVKHCNFIL